jgi:DNA-binding beta-propeller fold protein YncE
VVALAGALLLAGCTGDESTGAEEPASPTAAESASFSPPSAPPDGVTVTDLADGPVGLATVDDRAWAVLPEAGALRSPDGEPVPVGDVPLRVAATPEGLWVSLFGESGLVRVDPASGEVDRRVRLRPAGEPEGLAWDGESLWVVDQDREVVLPVDPATGRTGRPVEVGAAPRLVAAGPDGVYVGNFDGRSVTRVTTQEGGETVPSGDCLTPQGLAVDGGLVWVACTLDGRVVGLDATTLEQQVELPGLPYADAVVVHDGLVHVVGQQGPTVWTVDPAAGEVVGELVLGGAGPTTANVDATVAGDALVVSHPDARRLYGVPLDLVTP